MFHKVFRLYLSVAFSLVSADTSAQLLTLFEETDSDRNTVNQPESTSIRRDSDGNLVTGPEFTLVGTTRIGANYLAVVEDRSGEIISISSSQDSSVRVPGFPNYEIVGIGAGFVRVRYPDNLNCTEFIEQGVSCETSNIAVLNLANLNPIDVSPAALSSSDDQNVDSSSSEGDVNPFEAILRRASGVETDPEPEGAFQPTRISPEDVPPGMRIVSTPFGDRLVEADQ